jgi:hypothetical protein
MPALECLMLGVRGMLVMRSAGTGWPANGSTTGAWQSVNVSNIY